MSNAVTLKRGFIRDEIEIFAEDHEVGFDYAFMHWFYNLLFNQDDDEEIPEDENTDGKGERQIDIFKLDIDDNEKSAVASIIQVKNAKGFSANTISLMKTGLEFVFNKPREKVKRLKNEKLKNKILETREIMKEYGYGNIRVNCYFVTLGDENDIDDEAIENLENLFADFKSTKLFAEFNFGLVGVNELDRLINLKRSKRRIIDYDLPIVYSRNRASIIEFDSAGVRSLICTVTAKNLAKLAQEEPRDAVFDANVRNSLGLGGRVNKSIYSSATTADGAGKFWFMNNGITMVCDNFSINHDPDDASVSIQNLQIINGCQTTSTLRTAYENGDLNENVLLQLKIYASKDSNFVNKVVLATNNQNSIGTRDLYANDEIQKLIQRKIAEDFDLFYERKRGEAKSEGAPRSKIIKMEKAGQAYLAIFKKQPSIARAQISKIFTPDLYSDIFVKSRPWQLAVGHELAKFVKSEAYQYRKNYDEDDLEYRILTYGALHVSRVLWWVLENETNITSKSKEKLIQNIQKGSKKLSESFERSIEILEEITENEEVGIEDLNNYFKKNVADSEINKFLSSQLEES